MKMYEVRFFKSFSISENIYKDTMVVRECDLEHAKEKYGGIKSMQYIGDLFDANKGDGITVNVHCNLVGMEDIEKLIEQLQDKLNNLKIDCAL